MISKITSVLFSLFIAFFTISANAQEKGANQLSIGYGAASVYDFLSIYDLFDSKESSGVFQIGYKHAIKQRFMLGGALAYEKFTGISNFSEGSVPTETSYFTIALESDYRYISNPGFQMYSGLGIGLLVTDEESIDQPITFNIAALGFRVGKALSAIAEIGFGYKGVINVGASYQF